jgi:hypothetical protein
MTMPRNDFFGELPRRIAQIERNAARQFRGNAHPVALPGEKQLGLLETKIERFRNAVHRYDCLRAIDGPLIS